MELGGSKRRNRRMDTIGSLQHTEKIQQRAKEAEQTLRIAIKEEQADIQNRSTNEEEAEKKDRAKLAQK